MNRNPRFRAPMNVGQLLNGENLAKARDDALRTAAAVQEIQDHRIELETGISRQNEIFTRQAAPVVNILKDSGVDMDGNEKLENKTNKLLKDTMTKLDQVIQNIGDNKKKVVVDPAEDKAGPSGHKVEHPDVSREELYVPQFHNEPPRYSTLDHVHEIEHMIEAWEQRKKKSFGDAEISPSGKFGSARVDVRKLHDEKLNISRDGKTYEIPLTPGLADFLLTKPRDVDRRLHTKSDLLNYRELAKFADIPPNNTIKYRDFLKSAMAGKAPQSGHGLILVEKPKDVLKRLKLGLGEIRAGNNSTELKNDVVVMLDFLLAKKKLTKQKVLEISKKYLG